MQIDYRTLHEDGFLKDLLDAISDPDGFGFLKNIANRISNNRSNDEFQIRNNLAKSARGLTATFPVIVTEATQLEHAVMISKAIERKAMAMLQMLFAANQITNAKNAQDYLKNFHSNLSYGIDYSGMDVDDVIDMTNKMTESIDPDIFDGYDYKYQLNECIKWVYDDTKNNIHHHLSAEINPVSIREYICSGPLKEAEVWRSDQVTTKTSYDGDDPDSWLNHKKTEVITQSQDMPGANDIKNAYEALNKGFIKTDIAKANEAVPSLMVVNFVSLIPGADGSAGHKVVSTAVIGVKAMIHYVSSEDMVNRILMKNSDNHGLFNLIRATTREISFFNDFLFAINRAKIDALGKSGRGSNNKIWKILELRADKGKLQKASGTKNTDCAAIATLVINKSEVDLIKKYHRIDLTKPGQFVGIMRGYNLMCGVIVDEVAEKVDFLYDDGTKNFETLSFMSLERDNDNTQLKKIINVMTSQRR